MKKAAVILLLAGAVLALALFFGRKQENGYLRIHIRADSNEAAAQTVKYEVKDAVVAYLTPIVAQCETKEEAMTALEKELDAISDVADRTLRAKGYSYGARARLTRENFPTRVYEGKELKAGVYDALIVELGSGKGDNWWCVVYPPLCFTGGGNVVYRSKIAEIIRNFFQTHQS